ncbi:MAG: MBL fold metallo-hydrolase [Bradymonadia bacterium]
MLIRQLFDRETSTYTYLLVDFETRDAVIIDPVLEHVERDLKLIKELEANLVYVLDTHVHADHVTGAGTLKQRTEALSGVSDNADVRCADIHFGHGHRLRIGRHKIEVRATPGHTDGCLTYVLFADEKVYAFTGDTLLIRGCGRTDFQQGDARTLYRSVHREIFSLPPETIIYPGHDYRGNTSSSVAEERAYNPRLNLEVSEEQFITLMNELDLAEPKRIHDALPMNLGCGLNPINTVTDRVTSQSLTPSMVQWERVDRFVDVRTRSEFERDAQRLSDAVCVPLDEILASCRTWSTTESILVVCQTGQRSLQACDLLRSLGFEDVSNLKGGMLAFESYRKELT